MLESEFKTASTNRIVKELYSCGAFKTTYNTPYEWEQECPAIIEKVAQPDHLTIKATDFEKGDQATRRTATGSGANRAAAYI